MQQEQSMDGVLEGRVAIVTGASRGIGVGIAKRFAAEGAKVVITARTGDAGRDAPLPGTLAEVAAAIRATGGECLPVVADLAVPEDRARIVDETLAAWGGVDILVNNAARGFYGPTMEMSRKRLLLSFEINLYAPIDLMQRVVPSMRNRGGGWILNVSSATTRMPGPAPWGRDGRYERFHREKGPTIYASTKAALERMSAGAAAELSADGIAVNTLAPVEAVASEGAVDMGAIDATAGYEPLEQMAEAALLLCSEPPATCSALCVLSGPLLARHGRAVRGLDGKPMAAMAG